MSNDMRLRRSCRPVQAVFRRCPVRREAKTKKSLITKRFVIGVSIIYSALIILSSLSFHYISKRNNDIVRDTVDAFTQSILGERIDNAIDSLSLRQIGSLKDLRESLQRFCTEERDFIHIILYAKTQDENYFKVLDTIGISRAIAVPVEKDSVVQENKEINYLKKGLVRRAIDPALYSHSGLQWYNLYHPFDLKKKRLVIQFMVSSPSSVRAMAGLGDSGGGLRIAGIIVTVVLVIAVIALTAVFIQNYSLLISNLSMYMDEAAHGNLDVTLRPVADAELSQLAESFNSLIEEMKDLKVKSTAEAGAAEASAAAAGDAQAGAADAVSTEASTANAGAGEAVSLRELFTLGVSFMKEKRYEDAIAVLRTLVTLKPDSFGSYFNLGVSYAKNRNYSMSMAMFEKAKELNPAHELTLQYIEKVKRLQALHG